MTSIILIHPLAAFTAVLLFYLNAYLGISRHLLAGGRRGRYIKFNRNAHVAIGRVFTVLLLLTFPLGLAGIRQAGFEPFSTLHAYLGAALLVLLLYGAFLGTTALKGKREKIKPHGRLMLLGALLLVFQVLGGVLNLKKIGIL